MLSRPLEREHLEKMARAGIAAVRGDEAVRKFLERKTFPRPQSPSNRYFILGIGKASAFMAKAAEEFFLRFDAKSFGDGLVVTKDGHAPSLGFRKVRVLEAGHPVPDERGLRAAEQVLRFCRCLQAGDVLFVLLSGGASALLPAPPDGVTLADKQKLTELLLRYGAPIGEINALRKHCSRIKGGRLLQATKGATVVTLAISDVPGDGPGAIGSGLTVPDPTTRQECLEILARYQLMEKIPASIRAHLQDPQSECPKPGDPIFREASFEIIANNRLAVEAATVCAKELGYEVLEASQLFSQDIAQVVSSWKEMCRKASGRRGVIVCGGEPTVRVTGQGKGGRNQELALRLAGELTGRFSFLSCGTDGTDGPTEAAGAFCDETTVQRAGDLGNKLAHALSENNAYPYFHALDDLLITGPTSTNVMDLQILLQS